MSNTITLYPSNWLYNAGVVGFLSSLVDVERMEISEEMLPQSGEYRITQQFFSKLHIEARYFGENKVASIVAKNTLYRNYLQANQKALFADFVRSLDSLKAASQCDLCGNGWSLRSDAIANLNNRDPGKAKFLDRIKSFNIVHNSLFGPSINEFPNAFWSLKQSAAVCHLCSFLIIHHHLALTRLSDGSEIFINAPSFKVMYHLNEFAKEAFGASSREEARVKREILAMSVIEYATKVQATLGVWTGMNLEVVSRRGGQIEFFSLPYDVIQLLSDRQIAAILSEVGEFKILNLVLKQQYAKLVELGYRLLRESLADQGKRNDKLINEWLFLWKNKGPNLRYTSERVLRLYALIEHKLQRSKSYERTSITTA